MIVGMGSDIVDHEENSKVLEFDKLGRFPNRILSEAELASYNRSLNAVYLAGRFAAKEAILKALGTGMHDGISMKDIDIVMLPSGKPNVNLSGYVKSLADELNITQWHLTISHSKLYTVAFAIAETQ